ncbi:MAG: hypothetical protein P8L72_07795 [Flavobacteriaceae bacterium]|nr:hypothetical protein [Flavobacteriaceae bacterium]MDG2315253.1 hypothetical protein [Flavobacteriaceae bacterium]
MNKWLLLLSVTLVFFSCKQSSPEKHSISYEWTFSDESPSFSHCDSLQTYKEQYQCFQKELSRLLSNQINQYRLQPNNPLNDTLVLTLLIDQKGKISIKNRSTNTNIDTEFPFIDSLLQLSVSKMPNVLPATKTNVGLPVKSTIDLPLIFKTTPQ